MYIIPQNYKIEYGPITTSIRVGNVALCQIDSAGKFSAAKGKERECWRQAVLSHNLSMNSPKEHKHADWALRIIAEALHKKVKLCGPGEKMVFGGVFNNRNLQASTRDAEGAKIGCISRQIQKPNAKIAD